ncbi:uncharacterized protein LOC143738250 [Siphateles boraxobius]|uniref:uncharacterized protein LOC143738250 n=1 Tax=Siphateles boraxobius TaxID=180520 RepID=UPI004064C80F
MMSMVAGEMAKRCVFGCAPNKTLFSIPRPRWLRVRWLEFLHFEEEGLTVNSRLCSRHFSSECFQNLTQYEMGFAKVLYLKSTAVPSVYTVGAEYSAKPLTRDVGCQCRDQTPKKSASVQASFSTPRPKRRSKAVQVKPVSGSPTERSAAGLNDSMSTVKDESDFAYEPEVTQHDTKTLSQPHGGEYE